MQRNNRLAVFEHVNEKESKERLKNAGSKLTKRAKSPDNNFEDHNVCLLILFSNIV